jgi:thiamine-monophosphate kinase
MAEGPTLAELGEGELIRRLGIFAPQGQFADDAALLNLDDGGSSERGSRFQLVVNTDVLVEGVHFSEATTAASDVGWRAAVANLSDLAAMGCQEVLGITVGLVAPGNTPWTWVEQAYAGMAEALGLHGGILLGGDCSGGLQRRLAITALGRLETSQGGVIRRVDGRPGDQLVCTGPHGLSRLGLALLQGEAPEELPEATLRRAIAAHRRPSPRFDAVGALAASRPPGMPWRVAGCDSSDGLAAATGALAVASGCSALLDRDQLPLDPTMADLAAGEAWCLWGGEDFELVLALEPVWAETLVERLPGARRIGCLDSAGVSGSLRWADSDEPIATASRAFRHFG